MPLEKRSQSPIKRTPYDTIKPKVKTNLINNPLEVVEKIAEAGSPNELIVVEDYSSNRIYDQGKEMFASL